MVSSKTGLQEETLLNRTQRAKKKKRKEIEVGFTPPYATKKMFTLKETLSIFPLRLSFLEIPPLVVTYHMPLNYSVGANTGFISSSYH